MLPVIVQHSEALATYIFALHLALYQPQIRHLLQIVDALIVCNQRKTLSDLSRLFHVSLDPKALADFFRESPWTVDLIGKPRKKFMLMQVLELASQAGIPLKIMAGLDDSLGKKGKATKSLQAVDIHHNHNESSRKKQAWCNGYVFRSDPSVFCLTRAYTCARRKSVISIGNDPKTTACIIAANTTWLVRC
jgi:hypothetical protein